VDGLAEANPVQITVQGRTGARSKIYSGHLRTYSRFILIIRWYSDTGKFLSPYSQRDIMGSKAIDLKLGNSTSMAKDGDTLTAELQLSITEEVSRQVAPLKAKAESLLGSMDSVMTAIQQVFNPETRENLTSSISKIQKRSHLLSAQQAA